MNQTGGFFISMFVLFIVLPGLVISGFCLTGDTSKCMVDFSKVIVIKHDDSVMKKIDKIEKLYDKIIVYEAIKGLH